MCVCYYYKRFMPSVKKSPYNLGGIFYTFSVGNGYKNTDQHQTKPNQDQITPANVRNCVCKQGGGYRCSHITHEVQKTRGAGDHSCVTKSGAVSAPEHGGCGVGRHDGKNHKYDVEYGMLEQIHSHKASRSRHECNQNGQIHISAQPFIKEHRNKGGKRYDEGAAV